MTTRNDYEDLLDEVSLDLKTYRKKGSRLSMSVWEEFWRKAIRQDVETVLAQ